jgi:transposase
VVVSPIDVFDDIADDVARLVDGEADKSRLLVFRRGETYCPFTVEHDTDPNDETTIGVDIGHNHLLAADAENGESMLVSGREAEYVRCEYRSLRKSLQQAGAPRARTRAGNVERSTARFARRTGDYRRPARNSLSMASAMELWASKQRPSPGPCRIRSGALVRWI